MLVIKTPTECLAKRSTFVSTARLTPHRIANTPRSQVACLLKLHHSSRQSFLLNEQETQ